MNNRQHPEMPNDLQLNELEPKERSAGKPANGAAGGDRPFQIFAEPWLINGDGEVVTSRGDLVANPMGCDLVSKIVGLSPERLSQLTVLAEAAFMQRIVACVNACEGISTEDLLACTGLIARVGGR